MSRNTQEGKAARERQAQVGGSYWKALMHVRREALAPEGSVVLTADPVDVAVKALRREFPELAASLLPRFEDNARSAVKRRTFEVLHDNKRLSLLTLLNALDWGHNRQIVGTLEAEATKLAHVAGVATVYARLTDCERGTLLSTASEMALACFLIERGAGISFDHPCHVEGAEGGDIDILATWPWGHVAFEVYSPVHTIKNTNAGWISLRPDGLAERVTQKVLEKYGTRGARTVGLPDGTLKVVAVDLAYNDTAYLGAHLPLGKMPEEMREVDLGGADAVMAFTHYQLVAGHPVGVHGFVRSGKTADELWRELRPDRTVAYDGSGAS